MTNENKEGHSSKDQKFCPKCNFVDLEGKWKFCPVDGLKLKEPTSIMNALDTNVEINSRIIFDLGQYIDITLRKLYEIDPCWIRQQYGGEGDTDYSIKRIEHCVKNRIKAQHLYRTKLRNIIGVILSLEMKNPIIRDGVVFRTEKRFDQGQINQDEEVIIVTLDSNIKGPNNGWHQGYYATTGRNDTDNDKKLRQLMNDIKEDVFYSRRNKELYTLSELCKIFEVEGRVIKDLNFREKSKNVKVLNINGYILGEEIDQLFELVEFRQKINKLNGFKFNFDNVESMMTLLGFK